MPRLEDRGPSRADIGAAIGLDRLRYHVSGEDTSRNR
jgi:hypothetical protein